MYLRLTFFGTILLSALFSCHSKSEQQVKDSENLQADSLAKTENQRLKAVNIFSNTDNKASVLALVKDTIFILSVRDPQIREFIINKLFYDSLKQEFQYVENVVHQNGFLTVDSILRLGSESQIFMKSLGNPQLTYSSFPKDLGKKQHSFKVLKDKTKTQLFKGKYYFIAKLNSDSINIYNPLNKKMESFTLDTKFFEIRDFFLYDLDKDNYPEIFIFHVGYVPREDAISYTIYSLRFDSTRAVIR